VNDLPQTEEQHAATRDLDVRDDRDLVALLVAGQRAAFDAAGTAVPAIATAVAGIVERLQRGGRLHYVGAGTSGRLGVLDASEMPPTFGTPSDLVCAHIAGGEAALRRAVEGAEDDARAGAHDMRGHVRAEDAVAGISASGRAAFVIAALSAAREAGAYTIAIVNDERAPLIAHADVAIVLPTGAESIAGSTRLAAGTAQKVALNALSSAVMVRLGKVYDNLMVDVVASNAKLRARALRLVVQLTGLDDEAAQTALDTAGGRVKIAVVMVRRKVSAGEAAALLERERGSLRALL
jgi:N-acetylmuramic acid 6-phosphate etherase